MSAARPWDYEIWPHVSRRAAARAGFVGARHQRVLRASATRDASPLQHSLRCDTACPGEKIDAARVRKGARFREPAFVRFISMRAVRARSRPPLLSVRAAEVGFIRLRPA